MITLGHLIVLAGVFAHREDDILKRYLDECSFTVNPLGSSKSHIRLDSDYLTPLKPSLLTLALYDSTGNSINVLEGTVTWESPSGKLTFVDPKGGVVTAIPNDYDGLLLDMTQINVNVSIGNDKYFITGRKMIYRPWGYELTVHTQRRHITPPPFVLPWDGGDTVEQIERSSASATPSDFCM